MQKSTVLIKNSTEREKLQSKKKTKCWILQQTLGILRFEQIDTDTLNAMLKSVICC